MRILPPQIASALQIMWQPLWICIAEDSSRIMCGDELIAVSGYWLFDSGRESAVEWVNQS